MAAKHLPATVFQLTLAIAGEISDELALAVTNGEDVRRAGLSLEAEGLSVPDDEVAVRGLDESFAGHAAAKNAEAAKFFRAIYNGDFESEGVRCPGRRVAAAAAAQHGEIKSGVDVLHGCGLPHHQD